MAHASLRSEVRSGVFGRKRVRTHFFTSSVGPVARRGSRRCSAVLAGGGRPVWGGRSFRVVAARLPAKIVASRPAMTAEVCRSGATIASSRSTRRFGESEKRNSSNVSDTLLHSRVRFVTKKTHSLVFLQHAVCGRKWVGSGAGMRCHVLAAAKALRRPPSTMCRWRGREVCNTLKCNTAQPLRVSAGLPRVGRATTSAN